MVIVIIPATFPNTPKLQTDVRRATEQVGKDVVGINFTLGYDSMGFASIFFNTILSNPATSPNRLQRVTQRVALTLMKELQTDENGVHAYLTPEAKPKSLTCTILCGLRSRNAFRARP